VFGFPNCQDPSTKQIASAVWNVGRIFGSGRPIDPNSWRAFEASPDRCGHCGSKSIVHPVKVGVCVRRAAEMPHLMGL